MVKYEVTEYKEIACPLLNRNISQVYCDRVLDVVYHCIAYPPDKYINEKFDDIDMAGDVCHTCENRCAERVPVKTYYVNEYGYEIRE